jgi:hypothetical protein
MCISIPWMLSCHCIDARPTGSRILNWTKKQYVLRHFSWTPWFHQSYIAPLDTNSSIPLQNLTVRRVLSGRVVGLALGIPKVLGSNLARVGASCQSSGLPELESSFCSPISIHLPRVSLWKRDLTQHLVLVIHLCLSPCTVTPYISNPSTSSNTTNPMLEYLCDKVS